ncbi:MAG: DUF6261 family protein [Bergeyella cardium]
MKTPKLQKLLLTKLQNAEFAQFITRLLEDVSKANLDLNQDLNAKGLLDTIKSQSETYDKALMQVYANDESKKIAELDKIRDADLQSLKDSIKPYRTAKKEAEQKAYHSLKILFNQYKNLAKESYEEETKKLSILISQLKSDDYKNSVKELGIGKFVTEVETSNEAFDKLFSKRSSSALKKETYNTKKQRQELAETYRKFFSYIAVLAEVRDEPYYKSFLAVINNSRKYYADLLAKKGKPGTEKKEKK